MIDSDSFDADISCSLVSVICLPCPDCLHGRSSLLLGQNSWLVDVWVVLKGLAIGSTNNTIADD